MTGDLSELVDVVGALVATLRVADSDGQLTRDWDNLEERVTAIQDNLNAAPRNKAAVGLFRCPMSNCNRVFSFGLELVGHLNETHNVSVNEWFCPQCDEEVKDPVGLLDHFYNEHVKYAMDEWMRENWIGQART